MSVQAGPTRAGTIERHWRGFACAPALAGVVFAGAAACVSLGAPQSPGQQPFTSQPPAAPVSSPPADPRQRCPWPKRWEVTASRDSLLTACGPSIHPARPGPALPRRVVG